MSDSARYITAGGFGRWGVSCWVLCIAPWFACGPARVGGGAGGGSPVLITYRERCTYHITPRGYGAIPPMDTD